MGMDPECACAALAGVRRNGSTTRVQASGPGEMRNRAAGRADVREGMRAALARERAAHAASALA